MIRNRAAAAIAPEVHWTGDLLLVREGSRVNFTDLPNREISFAKTAVRRCVIALFKHESYMISPLAQLSAHCAQQHP